MVRHFRTSGMRIFIVVWFGQLISLLGTHLTGFALGVWVFQRTGSVTQFALISVFTTLPGIIVSPLAGTLVDRWNRRWAMILSDSGAGLSTLAIALLLLSNHLDIWHIYLATAVSSIFNSFQWPAYTAAITLLVPKQHLGRSSGMTQLGEAIARIISPMLGGILLAAIQIWGVLLIDFATFLFALVTLLSVRFPDSKTTIAGQAGKGSLLGELAYGWHYITARPGLLGLLAFFAATNFTIGIVVTLVTPLVLSFASAIVLGTVLSTGGIGMLLGSIIMSVWGGPKQRILGILGFGLLQGIVVFVGGLRSSAFLIAAAAFVFLFNTPIIFGCSQVIWQRKVAPEIQGRVFALRRMIAMSSSPLASLVAGPLADYLFEPLLVVGGPLTGTIGKLIGVGPGRGIGLLFIVMGILTMLTAAVGYLYPRLRMVEEELPDAITDNVIEA
jgi:DHA3 family macrolide efflux protein-like MFS transporter